MSISLVAASLAAAAIHFALGPDHVEELGSLGGGFYVAGALQMSWAVLAIGLPRIHRSADVRVDAVRLLVPAGIAINTGVLAAWVVSRTVGLPAGEHPWTPEAIGVTDAVTALLEGGLVLGLIRGWRRHPGTGLEPGQPAPSGTGPSILGAAPILALILVATVTALGTPHGHADGTGHETEPHAGMPGVLQEPHTP
jgi:hypothetical protein